MQIKVVTTGNNIQSIINKLNRIDRDLVYVIPKVISVWLLEQIKNLYLKKQYDVSKYIPLTPEWFKRRKNLDPTMFHINLHNLVNSFYTNPQAASRTGFTIKFDAKGSENREKFEKNEKVRPIFEDNIEDIIQKIPNMLYKYFRKRHKGF